MSFLQISPKITALPVIHGSGDFAIEVRRVMLESDFDCLAVPLPPSFKSDVEKGIERLPAVSIVVQDETGRFETPEWSPDADEGEEAARRCSYVSIDPCQPVIAALRIAMQEHVPRAFVDLETERFEDSKAVLPDPYVLKKVSGEQFAAALLPSIPRPPENGQLTARVRMMAKRLRELEADFERILFVCSITDWPWVREAWSKNEDLLVEDDQVYATDIYGVEEESLLFFLGELPFITGLYERARYELDNDENLSVDGIKELALTTRDRYRAELKSRGRKITPQLLSVFFRYVRNLSLVERRLTPDLYTLIVAAKQIAGDQFAIRLAETARDYPFKPEIPRDAVRLSVGQGQLPDGDVAEFVSRLPGHPLEWRTCELKPSPLKIQQDEWTKRWNPFGHCSWPPEDIAIERFRSRVKDAALDMIGNDLARSEKFNSSLKDGLDIRETLRNWHTGDLYVKVFPPARGKLDCVVMLFDSPADPRDYPWRITWHAENHDESTLSLFATDFHSEMIGPGIAVATYGGAMFLFPPRPIVDIWRDPRFDFCDTLEERMIAAASFHSREKHVAVLSDATPGIGFRRLAKKFGKKLVHVPLNRFSQETIQQLRIVHVLNGHQVRSYASHFIRKA